MKLRFFYFFDVKFLTFGSDFSFYFFQKNQTLFLMTILDNIIAHKKQEVAQRKALISVAELEKSLFFDRKTLSIRKFLDTHNGIIAEFKRKSPSKGWINQFAEVETVTTGYAQAGVSGLSILTDHKFFGGTAADLALARTLNQVPVLRKEFIVDEFQILEAKAFGADFILLIAACCQKEEIGRWATFAKSLGLEVLMEVHEESELELCHPALDVVGVNNRNLKTFEVNIENSVRLVDKIPKEFKKISESGISDSKSIHYLRQVGFEGFLIGENFMKTANPAQACSQFVAQL